MRCWHVSKKDLLERQTLQAKGETMWLVPENGTWYESFMTTEWRLCRVMIGAKVLQRRKARRIALMLRDQSLVEGVTRSSS